MTTAEDLIHQVLENKAHSGFAAVAGKIARERGVSKEQANAILASKTRAASASAHTKNPRLNKVRG